MSIYPDGERELTSIIEIVIVFSLLCSLLRRIRAFIIKWFYEINSLKYVYQGTTTNTQVNSMAKATMLIVIAFMTLQTW